MEQPFIDANEECVEIRESGRILEIEERAGKADVVVESGCTDYVEPCALSPAVAYV